MYNIGIQAMEKGMLPEWIVRMGIRYNCSQRLKELKEKGVETAFKKVEDFIDELRDSPIAIVPEAANEQHYEVAAEFFQLVLGEHLKYSSGFWDECVENLNEAESAMLERTVLNAQIQDGMSILELGCGWGSLTCYMAERFPNSTILAVSNSASQRVFIEDRCKQKKLSNVQVVTCDINLLESPGQFDRVVSVEMFEHMRNYEKLMEKVASFLKPEGLLFVHIFCHKDFAYPYETNGASNWMGKYFFTGGIMPSRDLLSRFPNHMKVKSQTMYSGLHYSKTAEAWAQNVDINKTLVLRALADCYGKENAALWFQRWKVFFLACAELFGYKQGTEWLVTHMLFDKSKLV